MGLIVEELGERVRIPRKSTKSRPALHEEIAHNAWAKKPVNSVTTPRARARGLEEQCAEHVQEPGEKTGEKAEAEKGTQGEEERRGVC